MTEIYLYYKLLDVCRSHSISHLGKVLISFICTLFLIKELTYILLSLVEPLLPRKSALNTVNFPHDGTGDTRNLLFQAVMRNQDNTSLPNMNEWELY